MADILLFALGRQSIRPETSNSEKQNRLFGLKSINWKWSTWWNSWDTICQIMKNQMFNWFFDWTAKFWTMTQKMATKMLNSKFIYSPRPTKRFVLFSEKTPKYLEGLSRNRSLSSNRQSENCLRNQDEHAAAEQSYCQSFFSMMLASKSQFQCCM